MFQFGKLWNLISLTYISLMTNKLNTFSYAYYIFGSPLLRSTHLGVLSIVLLSIFSYWFAGVAIYSVFRWFYDINIFSLSAACLFYSLHGGFFVCLVGFWETEVLNLMWSNLSKFSFIITFKKPLKNHPLILPSTWNWLCVWGKAVVSAPFMVKTDLVPLICCASPTVYFYPHSNG